MGDPLTIYPVILFQLCNESNPRYPDPTQDMTYRQKILKAFYPALLWLNKLFSGKTHIRDNKNRPPVKSIYELTIPLNNGELLRLEDHRGKKILFVNTASDCGYTQQYEDLQKLYSENAGRLLVVGFPANDFKEQEKGTDEEIASFCKKNYGVTFPMALKSAVVKGNDQNKIFQWLSHKELNGWNDQAPRWNFSKYLVDENGMLINYFDPAVSPAGDAIQKAIKK
jgi:glutathione peroxidase